MATTSPLRQRMIEDMTIRNLSQATRQSYIYAVRKFSRHFGRSPDRLGICLTTSPLTPPPVELLMMMSDFARMRDLMSR